jgi:hypothetical protein
VRVLVLFGVLWRGLGWGGREESSGLGGGGRSGGLSLLLLERDAMVSHVMVGDAVSRCMTRCWMAWY